jgi:hypothetical protein
MDMCRMVAASLTVAAVVVSPVTCRNALINNLEISNSGPPRRLHYYCTVLVLPSAASGVERIRAHWRNDLFAKGACDPEQNSVRPPKASLYRILPTTPATINVSN